MKRVHTLNSTYEIDGMRVRRVGGDKDPTPRMGKDGEWQTAERILWHQGAYVFFWAINDTGTSPATLTSLVISEEEIDESSEDSVVGREDRAEGGE